MVQAPIHLVIRSGLDFLARKLVPEVLVSGLATLLVMALFSAVIKATPPSSRSERPGFDQPISANGATTVDFMERVALSHVGGLKPPSAAATTSTDGGSESATVAAANSDAGGEPAAAVTAGAAALLPRPTPATSHDGRRAARAPVATDARGVSPPLAHHRIGHRHRRDVAAIATDVLPPPRPALETLKPVVVSQPAKTKPLHPLQYGVRLVASLVDSVPASGTRLVEGMASVSDALTSFAKKL